jgi:hypothetical protein
MPLYRVILNNGNQIDIKAESMLDDLPHGEIYFFLSDPPDRKLATTFKRQCFQGVIVDPQRPKLRLLQHIANEPLSKMHPRSTSGDGNGARPVIPPLTF